MIRFKEYLERRARRAAFVNVCLAGLAVFGGLFLGSCANEDLGKDLGEEGDRNASVAFNVSEAQNDAQAAAAKTMPGMPVTRAAFSEQLGMMNLTPEDLTTQRLAVQGAAGADLCLIETTTPGIFNPTGTANAAETAAEDDATLGTNGPATRANVTTLATLGNFTTIGYRGTSATGISNRHQQHAMVSRQGYPPRRHPREPYLLVDFPALRQVLRHCPARSLKLLQTQNLARHLCRHALRGL